MRQCWDSEYVNVRIAGLFPETHKPRLLQKVGFRTVPCFVSGMFPETNFPRTFQKVIRPCFCKLNFQTGCDSVVKWPICPPCFSLGWYPWWALLSCYLSAIQGAKAQGIIQSCQTNLLGWSGDPCWRESMWPCALVQRFWTFSRRCVSL